MSKWGAHAPSRVPTGALAGRNQRSTTTHLGPLIGGRSDVWREGACAPRGTQSSRQKIRAALAAEESLGRRLENQLRKIVKRLFPVLEVVRVFVHMPDVRNIFLFQVSVNGLADADQSVFVAGRNPQQFQF